MPTSLFEPNSTRSVIADWVELQLLASNKESISSSRLTRSESVRGEPVNGSEYDEDSDLTLELEITDSPIEKLAGEVWEELHYRQTVLGDLYPFELVSRGTGWNLVQRASADQPTRIARLCYTSCLLVSALRTKLLPGAKKTSNEYKRIYKTAPDAFQAISYLTASEILGGTAYWFGWPRISETPKYRDALETIVAKIGHGKLKERDPDWATHNEKDGTIDIVAWKSFADHRYGSAVIYGQVASGANWRGKSVSTFIKGYFFDWFEDVPSARYLPAMFMPFTLHADTKPSKDVTFDEAAIAAARRDSADFGMILDRLRLTELSYRRAGNMRPDETEFHTLGAQILRWTALALRYARNESIPA